MNEKECYKLVQHHESDWENTVAVSHDLSKLQKALKLVNTKNWKVLTDHQFDNAHQQTGNYFFIAPVSYF